MSESYLVIAIAILGSHFGCGLVAGKDYSASKRFWLGSTYAAFASILFFVAAVTNSGYAVAVENTINLGAICGLLAFILINGFFWARPDI